MDAEVKWSIYPETKPAHSVLVALQMIDADDNVIHGIGWLEPESGRFTITAQESPFSSILAWHPWPSESVPKLT